MIIKIHKIKKLGLVFDDYSRPGSLPDFKKFNLIYGWNGTGKTTLTRLFDIISTNTPGKTEYEVDDGATRYRQGAQFPLKLRVFNQDYVEKNIEIVSSRANSISILLGKENKELVDKIEENRKLLNGDHAIPGDKGKLILRDDLIKDTAQKSTAKDSKFTAVAKTIGAAIGGNALRDYRKPQAELDYTNLTDSAILEDKELTKHTAEIQQESMSAITEISVGKLTIHDQEYDLKDGLVEIVSTTKTLLSRTVASVTIARLNENTDIKNWVETGVSLQAKYNSSKCEFCDSELPIKRMEELAGHFNDADKELKSNIDSNIKNIASALEVVDALIIPDEARFYSSLKEDYKSAIKPFNDSRLLLRKELDALSALLVSKKSKTTESVTLDHSPSADNFIHEINLLNAEVSKHNKMTDDLESVKESARLKLKNHYLIDIAKDVASFETQIAVNNDTKDLLSTEIEALENEIIILQAKISSDHKACEVLNNKLSLFLGHNELSFSPHIEKIIGEDLKEHDINRGYDILRGTTLAVKLSEGEKTAIAFVYFLVHLSDKDFDIKNGIVVIDDPISSLDSNSLYQAFSFLKNSVRKADQVFILTHNFDFLKLLINWRRNDRTTSTDYFMIKNNFQTGNRLATIEKMDRELYEYESEYHYLFKLLKNLRDSQDDSIEKAYPIPNIGRKVWDTFLTFAVPNGKSQYSKVEELKVMGYDEILLDSIYKFVNDQSHITGSGFDPALVVGTKKAVKDLLEMINTVSPEHFRIIDQATS